MEDTLIPLLLQLQVSHKHGEAAGKRVLHEMRMLNVYAVKEPPVDIQNIRPITETLPKWRGC